MKPVSMCVHAYNEADALRRLVLSSLPMAANIGEWVILDHRSGDDTAAVIDELRDILEPRGIPVRALHEPRDLSVECTFADVRNATMRACTGDVIVLHDADFVIGPAFYGLVERAARAIRARGSPYFGATFTVPCVWDRLVTNESGKVVEHGRVWIHQRRPRITASRAVHYEQTAQDGRWEKLVYDDRVRRRRYHLTGKRPALARGAVLSVNVKPPERIALRDTMTMYMQDAVQGRVDGTWLEAHAANQTRSQPPYDYEVALDLRGWKTHTPNLDLSA